MKDFQESWHDAQSICCSLGMTMMALNDKEKITWMQKLFRIKMAESAVLELCYLKRGRILLCNL